MTTTLKFMATWIGCYYLLLTLLWIPFITSINWAAFVSHPGAYLIGGMVTFLMTTAHFAEKEGL
jgi:hypothetical protein